MVSNLLHLLIVISPQLIVVFVQPSLTKLDERFGQENVLVGRELLNQL